MRSSTLDMYDADNFRKSDISEGVTFYQICTRIDHVKTWNQNIHANGVAGESS